MARRVELTEEEWRSRLTPEQYAERRRQATERPVTGASPIGRHLVEIEILDRELASLEPGQLGVHADAFDVDHRRQP